MSLKSVKKQLARLGNKKDKSKTPAPAPEAAPWARGELRAEARPQIGGHRAKTPAPEAREPLIGNHRAQKEGFKKGTTPEGPRQGGGIGSHRAWTGGTPAPAARGELTIGKDRTSTRGTEKAAEKSGPAPQAKVAPTDGTLGPKKAQEDVREPSSAKKISDVEATTGPKVTPDAPLSPVDTKATTKTPAPTNYTAPMELDNYGTANNYTTANSYTTLNNYDAPNQYGTLGNYDTPNQYGLTYYDVDRGSLQTFSVSDRNLISSSESEPAAKYTEAERAALALRIQKAKATKQRAIIAEAVAKEKAEMAAMAPQSEESEEPVEPEKAAEIDSPYTVIGDYSNYGIIDDSSGVVDQNDISSSSEHIPEVRTADMLWNSNEFEMVSELERAAAPAPEVQEKYHGSAQPEVAQLHRSLREGRKNLNDVPETFRNVSTGEVTSTKEIERERLSKNEESSEGWALIGMRTKHREDDLGKGKSSHPWNVKYAMSEFMELEEGVANYIGKHMAFQREEMLCEIYAGKLVDVAGQHVDTNQAAVGGQAQRERLGKLQDRLKEARGKGLDDKIDKLEAKIQIVRFTPGKDKNIAGKFIYVMNAAGQFFATKPEQFKIHHSTMLASGAVACAGEIQVAGGVIKSISNMSGHYRPGPVFLWQAVKQLEMSGAPMDFSVDVVGVSRKFKTAHEFLGAMDPTQDPQLFDGGYAAEVLNSGGKSK